MGMKKNGQNQKDLKIYIYIYILREMSEGRLRSLGK